MDNQLLLSLLCVTLSWGFMGAYAQNSTTAATNVTASPATGVSSSSPIAPVANSTASVAGNMSTNGTTASVAGNMSTNGTTVSVTGNMSTNGTTVSMTGNMTTNGTTVSVTGNMTTNGTTVSVTGNMTNTTTASTVSSTTTATTTAIPVATLQTPISRTNCGTSKLCAAQPSTCDPATGTGCYFISAQQQSGQLYNFEVSGDSDGYLAAGVSTSTSVNGSQQAYVCANSNGNVRFFTGNITNSILSLMQSNVSNVKGAINSRKIQCTFAAVLPDTTIRAANYSLSVSNGTYDPNTGTFGQVKTLLFTNRVNLSNPTSNTTNQVANGAYPATYQQPLIFALLVTVVMLTFSAL